MLYWHIWYIVVCCTKILYRCILYWNIILLYAILKHWVVHYRMLHWNTVCIMLYTVLKHCLYTAVRCTETRFVYCCMLYWYTVFMLLYAVLKHCILLYAVQKHVCILLYAVLKHCLYTAVYCTETVYCCIMYWKVYCCMMYWKSILPNAVL